jgi:adenylate kinase family enzyme
MSREETPSPTASRPLRIKIAGICGSGKTTLAQRLKALGYQAWQVSQEHSGVPDLWRRRNPADVLVYLDASGPVVRARYPHLNLDDAYLDEQRRRLAHARAHADCYVLTDGLTPDEVLAQVLACLGRLGKGPER